MKRPKKYLTITLDTQRGSSQTLKSVALSCNNVYNSAGGEDGRRYKWFSIPVEVILKVLKGKKYERPSIW